MAGRGGSATVNGAGSTLAAPIYQQWASALESQGVTLNYNPVGSGTGVADLQTATVDFAGSDPALESADTSGDEGSGSPVPGRLRRDHGVLQPPGRQERAKARRHDHRQHLSGQDQDLERLGDQETQPGHKPARHGDHRGPPLGLVRHERRLHQVPGGHGSRRWKSQVGSDKDVKWPTGTGAAKNSGVAAAVKQTAGAIGYVEQAYAIENGFTYAAVKNSSGQYVLPTIQNTSAAASGIQVPADLGISTINSPGASAYPIVSQTFLDVYKDPCKDGQAHSSAASGLKKFLTYAFGPGQQTLGPGPNQLPYAPLPSSLVAKDTAQLGTMTCNGSPIS